MKAVIDFFRRLFKHPDNATHADSIPQTPPVSIPASIPNLDINSRPHIVMGDLDCNDDEKAMVLDAYSDLSKVILSDQFKQKILAAQFTETNGLGNDEIYGLIVAKSPITVAFSMFSGSFKQNYVYKTMGYEDDNYPNTCFANRHFVQDKETCASLILHETMHVIGFHHYDVMESSVPYTMNRIYDEIAQELGLEPAQ